jgi:helix-turn-helix protein
MTVIRSFVSSFSKDPARDPRATTNLVCLSDADVVAEDVRHDPAETPAPVADEADFRYSLESTNGSGLELEPEIPNVPRWSRVEPLEPHQTLGQLMIETREHRGISREQVADETHIPAYYVKMIESDHYDAIPDQLYLLPFFRRYAVFLGLDEKEVVSRFIHDFEQSENESGAVSAPGSAARRALWRRLGLAGAAAGIVLTSFVWGVRAMRTPSDQPVETSSAEGLTPNVPPAPPVASNDVPAVVAPVHRVTPAPVAAASPAVNVASEKPQVSSQPTTPKRSARKRSRSYLRSHRWTRTRN